MGLNEENMENLEEDSLENYENVNEEEGFGIGVMLSGISTQGSAPALSEEDENAVLSERLQNMEPRKAMGVTRFQGL